MALPRYSFLLCLVTIFYPQLCQQLNLTKFELEAYIAARSLTIDQRYRPHYHVAPRVGWMNDPNGFSYYKGEYHLFYQYYPYDSVWGPMHWGHSSSPDLVNWKVLPTALFPEEAQCFSGSGIVVNDTLVLMYTAHEILTQSPLTSKESQYLANSTDGVNFQNYEGNPVLPAAPNNSSDFRDPKVWKYGDYWYVILGSKTDDGERGRVLLYRSPDMISWQFLSILGETGVTGSLGYMWECPDFFELDGRYVLLWSPQGMTAEGDRYKNIYQTGFLIGTFNYDDFTFVPETTFQELDYGHDYYASQTVEKDGKRFQIAWFNTWEQVIPEAVDGWAGMMTLIRELTLSGDRVLMKPVDDIIKLRDEVVVNGTVIVNQTVEFGQTGELLIDADLEQKIEIFIVGRNGGNKVWLRWDPAVRKVVVDRDGEVRQVEWTPLGSYRWRLFLDASSLELFCGEGEVVFSSRTYPDGEWDVTNLSNQTLTIVGYTLKRSVAGSDSRNHSNPLRSMGLYMLLYCYVAMSTLFVRNQ